MDTETDGADPKAFSQRRESLSKREKKLGHRRVTVQGKVTYKKTATTELQSAIQLGISNIVGRTESSRDVLLRDFQTIETVDFPSRGGRVTPAHSYSDFQFKTVAPVAFSFFRRLFAVDKGDYLNSVCVQPLRELSNPGASGSVFFITEDDEFIIKTVQHKEANFLMKLLPQYYMNLTQHPCTLLPKFYGLHCYQSMGKNIRIILMNNLLPSSLDMHEKYDLKGSTYKRKASEKELAKKHPTLKDLDFKRIHANGIFLRPETYDSLRRTIERDCLVLASLNIMDYSFLLGIYNLSQARRNREADNVTPTSSHQDLPHLDCHMDPRPDAPLDSQLDSPQPPYTSAKDKSSSISLVPRFTLKMKHSRKPSSSPTSSCEDEDGGQSTSDTLAVGVGVSEIQPIQQVARHPASRSRSVKRITAYSTPMAMLEEVKSPLVIIPHPGERELTQHKLNTFVPMATLDADETEIQQPMAAAVATSCEVESGSSAYGTNTCSESSSQISSTAFFSEVGSPQHAKGTGGGSPALPTTMQRFVSGSITSSSTMAGGSVGGRTTNNNVNVMHRQFSNSNKPNTGTLDSSACASDDLNSSGEKITAPALTVIENISEEINEMGGLSAWNSQGDHLILFPGIIDILQDYRIRKRVEHAFKSIVIDGDTVSVTEPKFYADRFQNFLLNHVFHKLPSYVPCVTEDGQAMIPSNSTQLTCDNSGETMAVHLPNLFLKEVDSPFLENMRRMRQDTLSSDASNYSSLARSHGGSVISSPSSRTSRMKNSTRLKS